MEEANDAYPRIEERFLTELDESLQARGSDMLYDVVAGLSLPIDSIVLDVGCGEGRQAVALAQRFGFTVTGIDPVGRNLELAAAELAEVASTAADLRARVRFELGRAESLPADDGTVDLVWSKDVLGLVPGVDRAYCEFARVLRSGGRAVIYQSCFATDGLTEQDLDTVSGGLDVPRENMDSAHTESAIAAAGLHVDACFDVGLEWGEHNQEYRGTGGRRLLHAARLLRDPERYIGRFGRWAYDIMLADCYWHVFRMLGKLGERVYVLTRP